MSDSYVPETVEYDLSQLIDLSVTFKPLQITLNGILTRLASLEQEKSEQANAIQQLQEELATLRQEQDARPAPSPVKSATGEETAVCRHDDLWDAIEGIKSLLGDLQDSDERQRATIDELYAARKRRASQQPARVGSAGAKSYGSVVDSQSVAQQGDERRPSAPRGSSRRPTQGDLYATEEVLPVGDLILNLAHENLPLNFDATVAFSGEEGTQQQAPQQQDGGELPTSERPGSSSASGVAKQPMPPPPRRPTPPHAGDGAPLDRPASGESEPFAPKPFDPSAAAALRPGSGATGPRVSRASRSVSIMGRIREDGEDIAYLNRVVAEMLAEMKDLHNDMDMMRTTQDNSTQGVPAADGGADLSDLVQRLQALEGNVDSFAAASQLRDNGLQSDLEDLRKKLRPASYLTDDDVDTIHSLADTQKKLRELEDRVKALEKAHERLDDKLGSVLSVAGNSDGAGAEISGAQFALLSSTVDGLEKQLAELQSSGEKDWSEDIDRLQNALQRLRGETDDLTSRVASTERETARLGEVKADRSDLPAERRVSAIPTATTSADIDHLAKQLAALSTRVDAGQAKDRELDETKADRESLQRLRDDLSILKKMMEVQAAERNARNGDGENGGNNTSAATEQLLRELQQQLVDQANRHAGATADHEDISDLRERVEALDHCKADATLVANKAERDYVENALERLMREVEQVLNATNAGIIDTLDKSLNILRDMIDGRATKQDIARLQQLMAEESGVSGSPDGLTGFKGYRCLGCNRPMDSLRPRAQAAKLQPFVNRTPQNYPQDNVTRTIQQQQRGTAMLEQRSVQGDTASHTYPTIEGPPR